MDFERSWLSKFSRCSQRIAGEEITREILQGSERFSSGSSQDEIIGWTKQAMDRLDALLEVEKRKEIMTGCACRYPQSELQDMKEAYEKTRNVDLVHQMLQDKFVWFLRNSLRLNDELVQEIVKRGWGLAGVREGNTIIATKIPKSGNLREYMKETDGEKRRELYCHCPRIREAVGSKTRMSPTYCYCGAGFCKAIWDYILGQPVEVELLESVLKGDDVCRFAVHLPEMRP
jgi:hypothetical protein